MHQADATRDGVAGFFSGHPFIELPHADNSYGGTFYVNSVAFGRWDDFIGRELVGYIDGRYRTMRDRRHRGIAGARSAANVRQHGLMA